MTIPKLYPEQTHNPPWIENDERMSTSTFTKAQINGIQVDIWKYPA